MTSTTATAPTMAAPITSAPPSTATVTSNYPSRVAEIDNKHVVADEAALSPLSKPGKTVVFRRIRELLLDDGTTVYRCTECPETNERLAKIRFHLQTHNTTGHQTAASAATAKAPKKADRPETALEAGTADVSSGHGTVLPDLTLAELASRLHELAELDALRAEVTTLREANAHLKAEYADLRTGHDELLAATRMMPTLVRRAEATEKLIGALHTAIHDLQESV